MYPMIDPTGMRHIRFDAARCLQLALMAFIRELTLVFIFGGVSEKTQGSSGLWC